MRPNRDKGMGGGDSFERLLVKRSVSGVLCVAGVETLCLPAGLLNRGQFTAQRPP